jgi:hypothetical protein
MKHSNKNKRVHEGETMQLLKNVGRGRYATQKGIPSKTSQTQLQKAKVEQPKPMWKATNCL